jgi:hypothetical protein
MENLESILYTKNLIKLLDDDDYFNVELNPFTDRDMLYSKILEISIINFNESDSPKLTVGQIQTAMTEVLNINVKTTFDDMVDSGLIEPSGLDSNGDIIYLTNNQLNIKNK